LFLPFAHSDFIFAVIGEELGLVGTLAVLLVLRLFLWRGIRTSLLAPDRFGKLLALGIVSGIVAQALFNMSVVLSLVPTKGIPLPFISYGGSSLVPNAGGCGYFVEYLAALNRFDYFGSLALSLCEPREGTGQVACRPREENGLFAVGVKTMRVLIAAGGTGGHIYPGIGGGQEILRRDPKSEVRFVGTARGLENKLVPAGRV